MKIVSVFALVGALFASHALARVGETSDEATVRYGPPSDALAGAYSNTTTRIYNKDGVRVEATFMMSSTGKSIIGEIRYSLPRELGQSNVVAKAVLMQLLEANAAGQSWEIKRNLPTKQDYSRQGAFATLTSTMLTITLDEYSAYIAVEKNRIVTEQTIRIDKNIKEF
jgi:hypothetical protein